MTPPTKQKVLTLTTEGSGLRSEVIGWGGEDPNLYVPYKPIGMTPGCELPQYDTVLQAMADGWHLLAPPEELSEKLSRWWMWWLVMPAGEPGGPTPYSERTR